MTLSRVKLEKDNNSTYPKTDLRVISPKVIMTEKYQITLPTEDEINCKEICHKYLN